MEIYLKLGYGLLIFFMVIGILKIILNTIVTERDRKKFMPLIKKGDIVYTPTAGNPIDGEVLEVNGDRVKIIITVFKSRVYQK
jgi:hypothetical protein